MKKYLWLGVTLAGAVVSFYGNRKVQEAVQEEQFEMQRQVYMLPRRRAN